MKVTRVTKTEFKLDTGYIFPINPPLEKDMTPAEFQEHYDQASNFIKSCQNPGNINSNTQELG